jgi:hypothetical protein
MLRYVQGRGEDANVKKIFAEKRPCASESGGAFADKKAGALAPISDGQWLVLRPSDVGRWVWAERTCAPIERRARSIARRSVGRDGV